MSQQVAQRQETEQNRRNKQTQKTKQNTVSVGDLLGGLGGMAVKTQSERVKKFCGKPSNRQTYCEGVLRGRQNCQDDITRAKSKKSSEKGVWPTGNT